MKRAVFMFATVAAVACVGIFLAMSGVSLTPAWPLDHLHIGSVSDLLFQATPALLALRTRLTELETSATAKRAEIVEGLSEEAVRAIETAHDAILTEITQVRTQITEAEAVRTPDPGDSGSRAAAEAAVRAERERVGTITDLAARAHVADFGQEHVRAGTSVDAFRTALLDRLVAAEGSAPTDSNVRAMVGTEEVDRVRSAKIEALAYGLGAPVPQAGPSEAARQFMGRGLVDLAADSVNYRGGRMLNARQIDDIFTRASMTTSDFPIIFEGAINRTLEQRYALAQPTFKRFARKRNFRDFRPDTAVKLGDFPLLQKVLESGEIKYGSFVEGKEQVQAFSYAIALRITRQMLINDDLGAISELLTSYGGSVALFEEVTFYVSAFNGKLADGKDVYHTDHKNLASAGTVIDVENVGKGRAAMSKQKSTEGNPLLANPPKILLTGPDKLTEAEKLLASITPATVSNVNIFSGRLEPLETSQISGNAWHLLTDPSYGSNYRWGYLDGYEAPRVRMDEPFGQQGFAMSVEHDFGCGATDFRFGYKNPGA